MRRISKKSLRDAARKRANQRQESLRVSDFVPRELSKPGRKLQRLLQSVASPIPQGNVGIAPRLAAATFQMRGLHFRLVEVHLGRDQITGEAASLFERWISQDLLGPLVRVETYYEVHRNTHYVAGHLRGIPTCRGRLTFTRQPEKASREACGGSVWAPSASRVELAVENLLNMESLVASVRDDLRAFRKSDKPFREPTHRRRNWFASKR